MRTASAFMVIFAGIGALASIHASDKAADNQQWLLASESGELKLYSRIRAGCSLKEFKAIGMIEAPTPVVHNVINDAESYPKFMPYISECRIIKREGNSVYSYQRVSPTIVGDRDYTLRIVQTSWPANGGLVFCNKWEPANEAGPAEKKGVLRVKSCDGAWLLEPESTEKTRATYSVYTDTGGHLPTFIANSASSIGIRKIFAAVREQVKDPKYRADRTLLEPVR